MVQLLPFQEEDAEALYALRSDKDFMKYLGMDPYHSMSQAEEMVQSNIQGFKEQTNLSWKISPMDSTQLIGYIGLWRFFKDHFRAEIGFGLSSDFRGKGMMSDCILHICKYAFKSMNINSISADVDPDNIPSIKLLEKVGFQHEGHLRENYYYDGRFIDSVYMGLLRSDVNLF